MRALGDAARLARHLEHEVRALVADLLKPLRSVFCHVRPSAEMGQQHLRAFAVIGMVFDPHARRRLRPDAGLHAARVDTHGREATKRGLAGGSHMAAPLADSELADARALAPTEPCGSAGKTGASAETAPAS